jgi:hypothetical protein
MYTALRATSQTLAAYIRQRLEADPNLAPFFTSGSGGNMVVSLNTPQEMAHQNKPQHGVSVWLYRVIRDEQRLNAPPERLGPNQLRYPPLPLCLHYLVPSVIGSNGNGAGSLLEQKVLTPADALGEEVLTDAEGRYEVDFTGGNIWTPEVWGEREFCCVIWRGRDPPMGTNHGGFKRVRTRFRSLEW